jgi:hypothetical protein
MYTLAITGCGCPCFLPFIIFPKPYAMKENYDQVKLTSSALLVQIMNLCDQLQIKKEMHDPICQSQVLTHIFLANWNLMRVCGGE